MRSGIAQWHHRLGAEARDVVADTPVDRIERFVPARRSIRSTGACTASQQRLTQSAWPMDVVGIVAAYLFADHRCGIGIGRGATYPGHPAIADGDRKTTGVGAVQGTDTGSGFDGSIHGGLLEFVPTSSSLYHECFVLVLPHRARYRENRLNPSRASHWYCCIRGDDIHCLVEQRYRSRSGFHARAVVVAPNTTT
jgi:hypothetical protein